MVALSEFEYDFHILNPIQIGSAKRKKKLNEKKNIQQKYLCLINEAAMEIWHSNTKICLESKYSKRMLKKKKLTYIWTIFVLN